MKKSKFKVPPTTFSNWDVLASVQSQNLLRMEFPGQICESSAEAHEKDGSRKNFISLLFFEDVRSKVTCPVDNGFRIRERDKEPTRLPEVANW